MTLSVRLHDHIHQKRVGRVVTTCVDPPEAAECVNLTAVMWRLNKRHREEGRKERKGEGEEEGEREERRTTE